MEECLIDVLNARDTVLHVFPVAAGDPASAAQEALRAAADLHLVPESEAGGLHARAHVGRGGPLAPFGDVLAAGQPSQDQAEHLRTHAYFLWQQAGCPDDRAEEHWHEACAATGRSSAA